MFKIFDVILCVPWLAIYFPVNIHSIWNSCSCDLVMWGILIDLHPILMGTLSTKKIQELRWVLSTSIKDKNLLQLSEKVLGIWLCLKVLWNCQWRRANVGNISFRDSFLWLIHIMNSVNKTKLSVITPPPLNWDSNTALLETHPL